MNSIQSESLGQSHLSNRSTNQVRKRPRKIKKDELEI